MNERADVASAGQTMPGSPEGSLDNLSLAAVLNLLFLLRGEWGSVGDYITKQRALRTLLRT